MKRFLPALLFLAFVALFYFVPFWLILQIVLIGTLVVGIVILFFMVLMDFFVGDE